MQVSTASNLQTVRREYVPGQLQTMTLPPASSSCSPRPSSWFFTRDGSAPGMSHLVSATMMGQPAALACASASSVCAYKQQSLSFLSSWLLWTCNCSRHSCMARETRCYGFLHQHVHDFQLTRKWGDLEQWTTATTASHNPFLANWDGCRAQISLLATHRGDISIQRQVSTAASLVF